MLIYEIQMMCIPKIVYCIYLIFFAYMIWKMVYIIFVTS